MKANELYEQLEKDFIKPGLTDDWSVEMGDTTKYVTDNFKKRSMGLVCDFTDKIKKAYTAVFPSDKVMIDILNKNEEELMLFVHHPCTWDIRQSNVFVQMNKELLCEFRNKRISIYNLHSPLDNFGEYSTSSTLAKAIGLEIEKPFAPYNGGLAGVIGGYKKGNIDVLKNDLEKAIGHRVGEYLYGDKEIYDSRVAVAAGGGNDEGVLNDMIKENINILVTGVSVLNDFSKKAHELAKSHKINILGGAHYSTEKFACIEMVKYFQKKGLESEFLEDKPVMEDL